MIRSEVRVLIAMVCVWTLSGCSHSTSTLPAGSPTLAGKWRGVPANVDGTPISGMDTVVIDLLEASRAAVTHLPADTSRMTGTFPASMLLLNSDYTAIDLSWTGPNGDHYLLTNLHPAGDSDVYASSGHYVSSRSSQSMGLYFHGRRM